MEQNIARVRSLVAVLTPMAASIEENLRLIDEMLCERENMPAPRKGSASEVEMRRFGRGELSREIRSIAERLKTVSAPAVIDEMRKLDVVVHQNRPESSIGNALRRLARDGVLKEVKPGSGRAPAIYQFWARGSINET